MTGMCSFLFHWMFFVFLIQAGVINDMSNCEASDFEQYFSSGVIVGVSQWNTRQRLLSVAAACEQETVVAAALPWYNLEDRDFWGWTALFHACRTGNRRIIDMLLAAGAKACLDEAGASLVDVAIRRHDAELAEHLARHFDFDRTLYTAALSNPDLTVEMVRYLLGKGGEARSWRYLCTPLHFAVEGDQVEAAAELIRAGADVNARRLDNGYTPLIQAVRFGRHPDMVRLLLSHGADPSLRATAWQYQGLTALEIGRLALDRSHWWDVNVAIREGYALRRAAIEEMVRILEEREGTAGTNG